MPRVRAADSDGFAETTRQIPHIDAVCGAWLRPVDGRPDQPRGFGVGCATPSVTRPRGCGSLPTRPDRSGPRVRLPNGSTTNAGPAPARKVVQYRQCHAEGSNDVSASSCRTLLCKGVRKKLSRRLLGV